MPLNYNFHVSSFAIFLDPSDRSSIPDIVRHMSNCIVRAEREVYLATNFWQASDPARLITNAFKELSRRAGERGNKVVIKVIYDRGNAKQVGRQVSLRKLES